MTTYIIEMDLGPEYGLRLPAEGESLEDKQTIDLTAEQFEGYTRAQVAWWEWQNQLGAQYKRLKRGNL